MNMEELQKHKKVLLNIMCQLGDLVTGSKVKECEDSIQYFISLVDRMKKIEGVGLLPKEAISYDPTWNASWNKCREETKVRLMRWLTRDWFNV